MLNHVIDITYLHQLAHDGKLYVTGDYIPALNKDSIYYYTIHTADNNKEVHIRFGINTTAPLIIGFFKTPTITTPGAVLTKYNRKSGSTDTGNMVFRSAPVISNDGTRDNPQEFLIGGNQKAGGNFERSVDWKILEPNAVYLLKFTGTINGTGVSWFLEFYEHGE